MSQIQLEKATAFIKIGKRGEARTILVELLKAEPDNASGWWLMANAVSDTEHKKRALQRFLQLRPGDLKAEAMLSKLDLPTAHNPFKDPDNPFVAAKQNRQVGEFDDPFAGIDDDDPFGEEVTRPALSSQKTQSQSIPPKRTTQTVKKAASGGNTNVVIAVVILALLIVVAGVVFTLIRNNSNSSGANNSTSAFVETEFHCSENETGTVAREFDAGVELVANPDVWQASINMDQLLIGYFSGETGSNKFQYFTFNGEAGQWVVLEVQALDEPIDPELTVYDTAARRLAWCANPDDMASAYMEILLPSTGMYKLTVMEFFTMEGTYELTLRER